MSLLKQLLRYAYENRGHRGRYYGEHDHNHRDYQYDGSSHRNTMATVPPFIGRFLKGGKKLLWVLVGLTALMILVVVALAIAVMPLFSQIFDYFNQNGIKGAVDLLTGLLQRIWGGSGK
jgi:hypothetical protein